jgi:hypothetical protein
MWRPGLHPLFVSNCCGEDHESALTTHSERRIVSHTTLHKAKEATMAIMCSLAVCKAQEGMCGHEKAMLSVALLAAIGFGTYFLIG